jgi:hypothetical protein
MAKWWVQRAISLRQIREIEEAMKWHNARQSLAGLRAVRPLHSVSFQNARQPNLMPFLSQAGCYVLVRLFRLAI